MAVATHEVPIPKAALKALIELTGQPQVDVALLMTLRDAVEHRLEKIESALRDYEQKYGMTFQQFEIRPEPERCQIVSRMKRKRTILSGIVW